MDKKDHTIAALKQLLVDANERLANLMAEANLVIETQTARIKELEDLTAEAKSD